MTGSRDPGAPPSTVHGELLDERIEELDDNALTVMASVDDTVIPEDATLGRQVGRGALWAVAANITMRFASVSITAVLARLLSPADFGVFAVAIAVYLVVASLAELGMASAIARSATEPDDIAPTVASISIMVSLVTGIALAGGSSFIASLLGQPAAAEPIRVLALCVVLTGLFAVPGAQLVREFRQDRIFLGTIVGFVVSNPLLIVLALHGSGATAFAWSRVAGQIATGLVFWFSTSRKYRPGWNSREVRFLVTFGIPLSLANLVNWTLLNADYMILGRLVDAAEVGVYMIAFTVANWSTAVLGSVLNSVVVPAFGRVAGDATRIAEALSRSVGLVALVSLPIGAMTLALADPLVRTIFGEKWADSIPVLAVLSIYGVLYAFSLLYANILVALGSTLRLLVVQLAWVSVLVPTMIVALHLWGLQGAAWAHVVTLSLIALPAYAVMVLRTSQQKLSILLKPALRPLVVATLAAGGAWLAASLVHGSLLRLLVGGCVGGLIYLVGCLPAIAALLPARVLYDRLPARWRRGADLGALP